MQNVNQTVFIITFILFESTNLNIQNAHECSISEARPN